MPDRPHFWISENSVSEGYREKNGRTFTYERENFTEHGKELQNKISNTLRSTESKEDILLTNDLFLQLKTPDNVDIKRESIKLKRLGFEIMSYSSLEQNQAFVGIKKSKFTQLQEKVSIYINSDGNKGKTNISVIEEIKEVELKDKIDPRINLDENVEYDCIISLYSIININERVRIFEKINGNLFESGIEQVNGITFPNGIFAITTKLYPVKIREIGERYISISSIKLNSKAIRLRSFSKEPFPGTYVLNPPETSITVGVLDSGITTVAPFTNLVTMTYSRLPHPSNLPELSHGTFVASRILFGDNIETQLYSGLLTPRCTVCDIQVFGKISLDGVDVNIPPDEAFLVQVLGEIIPQIFQTVRIINISLGLQDPIIEGNVSIFASNLDYLSRKYDILFITSSGNIDESLTGGVYPDHFNSPLAKIQAPAESLLSMTVGSIAKISNTSCFATENEISPFSCIGPGIDGGIKPEVVAHGGNQLNNWNLMPGICAQGIDSNGLNIAYDIGTSYSAPIIANFAAKLLDFYQNPTINLIKALIYHFTEERSSPTSATINKKFFCGFGEPNLELAMSAKEHNAVFLYQGKINQHIEKEIKFHIPSAFADFADTAKLKIKFTIVYNPPVSQHSHSIIDYSKSRISCKLYKKILGGMKGIGITNNDSNYILPWNPIIKFEKIFHRNYSVGEWAIILKLFIKDELPYNFEQDFSIVIEIIDINRRIDVYTEILNEFSEIYSTARTEAA